MKKYFFIFLLFTGCTRQNSFKDILTGNQDRDYWVRKTIDTGGHYIFLNSNLQFSPDGRAAYYITNDEHKIGNSFMFVEGPVSPLIWTFDAKDSTFRIGPSLIYKVAMYTRDTILMEGKGYKGRFALIRRHGEN